MGARLPEAMDRVLAVEREIKQAQLQLTIAVKNGLNAKQQDLLYAKLRSGGGGAPQEPH